jgi:peptidoglycan hydrolase-like amidase
VLIRPHEVDLRVIKPQDLLGRLSAVGQVCGAVLAQADAVAPAAAVDQGDAGAAVIVDANYWRGIIGPGRVLSTWFDIEDRGTSIALVNGRGWGHGVGLRQ